MARVRRNTRRVVLSMSPLPIDVSSAVAALGFVAIAALFGRARARRPALAAAKSPPPATAR